MSCEEIENRILDCPENQLPPAQRQEVEAHLATCAGCRTFARQLQRLDAALSTGVKVPALPADFDRRLRERIEAAPPALSEAQRAERKRQLQAEFEAGMARLGQGSFALGSLLSHLTGSAMAAAAGALVWLFTSPWAARLNPQSLGGFPPNALPWLAASAVFLAIGLGGVFPRQWRALLQW
jgi:anti-sigma factor RsiW